MSFIRFLQDTDLSDPIVAITLVALGAFGVVYYALTIVAKHDRRR